MRLPSSLLSLCVAAAIAGCEDSPLDSYPFPDGPVTFTHPPLDLAGAESFVPMGEPNVVPKEHGGFRLANPYRFPAATAVYAVRDGVVFQVRHGRRQVPPIHDAPDELWGREYDDWALRLQVSEDVIVNYAHVTDLHPDFAARIGDVPTDERPRDVFVEVRGGELLAYVDPHAAMDFSVTDRRLTLSFLNPSRYPEEHVFAGDVTAYFVGALQAELLAITLRSGPPWGGKIDYDVPGRIVGNWFLEGTTSFTQWSRQLAIVYDHIEADRVFIADGSPMSDGDGAQAGRPDIWWVRGNTPDPATVGVAEGAVSYELTFPGTPDTQPGSGVLLVEMIEEGRIRVEVFPGATPGEVAGFTAAAKTYVR